MTPEEESHLHLEECISGLNEAWWILQQLKSATPKSAIYAAAYRYALIAYARSYTGSNGEHKKGRSAYKRPEPRLSEDELSLHRKIMTLRDKALAHSDLTIKDASVYVGRYGGQAQAIIGSNITPSFPEISLVISLIENSLDLLYSECSQSLEDLAPPEI